MEKTFANAVLLSATVVVACLVIFPPLHLWAQNEIHINENVKVHKETIEDVRGDSGTIIVHIDESSVPVYMTASTTVALGTGEDGTINNLEPGANVYIFGSFSKETQSITADKVIIRNRRITERTSRSRAEEERLNQGTGFGISTLGALGLTSK